MNWRNRIFASNIFAAISWLILSPLVAKRFYTILLLIPRWRKKLHLIVESFEHRIITFPSGKVELQGYLLGQDKTVVIYFGGRASNLLENIQRAEALMKLGVSVFVFDYRGFGVGDGSATLNTIVEDGLAAYDAVASLGHENIILYGESLGASVASYVSSKRDARALILQSGFSNLELQAKDSVPLLHLYPKFMFPKTGLDTERSLKNGHPPLLIVHGDADERVSVKHADLIHQAAKGDKRLVILPNVGHKGVYLTWRWQQVVGCFLDAVKAAPTSI